MLADGKMVLHFPIDLAKKRKAEEEEQVDTAKNRKAVAEASA